MEGTLPFSPREYVQPNLQEAQVVAASCRAKFVLYKLKTSFTSFTVPIVKLLYKALVRPHIEFAITAWPPL